MTESELTGHEKYLMCMGYLEHIANYSKQQGKPVGSFILSEVSSRIEEKFTNNNIFDTKKLLDKIFNFSCTEIMNDIIIEIENETDIKDDVS